MSVSPEREQAFLDLTREHGVPARRLGETGGPRAVFDGLFETSVADLRETYETAIPRLLGEQI